MMEQSATEQLDRTLDDLRPGLEADGFEVAVEAIDSEGTVVVALRAGASACHDCLVPDATLVRILETSIRKQEPDARVRLRKYGFD